MAGSIQALIAYIKERRAALGLSQRQLAERAGINPGTLANIELGRVTKAPRPDTLTAIARGLRVAPETLLRICGYGEFPEPGPKRRGAVKGATPVPPRQAPFYGKVGCGEPVDLTGDPLELLTFDAFALGEAEVLVQACGDSMDRVGIVDGVFLVVAPVPVAPSGKIVIANLEGQGCTCKRYRARRKDGHTEHWLWPESTNPEHVPHRLGPGDRILGVVKRHIGEH